MGAGGGKVGQRGVKEREFRSDEDVQQAHHAKKSVEKGRKKVGVKRQLVEQLEPLVARLVDRVERPSGEGNLDSKVEMEEEVVVEKVMDDVEDIVVEERAEGMGMGKSGVSGWLREFLGHWAATAILDLP